MYLNKYIVEVFKELILRIYCTQYARMTTQYVHLCKKLHFSYFQKLSIRTSIRHTKLILLQQCKLRSNKITFFGQLVFGHFKRFVIKTFASKFIFVCTMYMVFKMDYFKNSRGFFFVERSVFLFTLFCWKNVQFLHTYILISEEKLFLD